jgi:salicylate hydroxylase
MAVEDGAVLGALFERLTSPSQIPDILTIYESLRKARTTRVVKGSSHYRDIFHMHDGDKQRERDRQLIEYNDAPFDGYPNKWRDPEFQPWLWGYDVQAEVERAWGVYQKGVFPLTTGKFRANL